MKPLLLFCLLTTLSFTSCEVKNTTKNKKLADNTPVKFIMENKYGLFNPLTKEVVVNPEYLYIENYSSGFCMASKGSDGELCDIIDLSGKKIFSYRNAPLSNTYCYNGLFSFVYDCNGEYYHGLYNSRGNIVYKSDFIYGMNLSVAHSRYYENASEEIENISPLASAAPVDSGILQQIVDELSNLKNEINTLKTNLSEIK